MAAEASHQPGFVLTLLVMVLAIGAPALLTVVATSDLSPAGRGVYRYFQHLETSVLIVGVPLHAFGLAIGAAMLFFAYLFDFHSWTGRLSVVDFVWKLTAAVVIFVGALCYSSRWPTLPIVVGVAATLLSVAVLRATTLRKVSVPTFSASACVGFFLVSMVCGLIWILWVCTPLFGGYMSFESRMEAWFEPKETELLTGFVIWSSPAIISGAFLLASAFAGLRTSFHVEEDDDEIHVGGELKFILVAISTAMLGCWVGASLCATSMGLASAVERLSLFVFVGVCLYAVNVIGYERICQAARNNDTILALKALLESDWMKAAALLFVGPLLPVYFLVEVMHNQIRRFLGKVGLESAGGKPEGWLSAEGRATYEHMAAWNWDAVLTKAMWGGILIFMLQVGISQGLNLFLSWLNTVISPLPLWIICLIIYLVGLVLFLLPPVPGLPIYFVAGIVVVNRCLRDGMSFQTGVLIAMALCWLIKITSVALLQKAVGDPYSDSVEVKKIVGTQTEVIRAVEKILLQRGLRADKVAVMVGGPDWPTSVLVGILKLRLADMLMGTWPCVVLIFPIVLASACTFQAGLNEKQKDHWLAVAHVFTALGVLVQVASMIVAGYYIQAVVASHKEELNAERPQDKLILEAIQADEDRSLRLQKRCGWGVQPAWLHAISVLGYLMMSCAAVLLFQPWLTPFKPFTLTDKVADLEGGSPLALVNPAGWAVIVCVLAGSCCLVLHEVWRHRAGQCEVAVEEEEEERLLQRNAEEGQAQKAG